MRTTVFWMATCFGNLCKSFTVKCISTEFGASWYFYWAKNACETCFLEFLKCFHELLHNVWSNYWVIYETLDLFVTALLLQLRGGWVGRCSLAQDWLTCIKIACQCYYQCKIELVTFMRFPGTVPIYDSEHKTNYYYNYYTILQLWILSGLPGWAGTRKVKPKPMWISWSKRQWVAVVSTGPYANLHLAPDNHGSTPPLSFCRPDALPASQPTASKHWRQ